MNPGLVIPGQSFRLWATYEVNFGPEMLVTIPLPTELRKVHLKTIFSLSISLLALIHPRTGVYAR
jgi:hypothetical protein